MTIHGSLYKHSTRKSIVCIGTSTGGPCALQEVLTNLPENIPASIVIVQHMPPIFTKSLAKRLNSLCSIVVKEAEHGEKLKIGTAYIAPGGYHFEVSADGTVNITDDPPVHSHRPAVDVLFESVCRLTDYNKIAIIMTGMGVDGAEGIRKLKEQDQHTYAIAESEQSCIVYGMPKAAINTGKIDQIIGLPFIAKAIMGTLHRGVE